MTAPTVSAGPPGMQERLRRYAPLAVAAMILIAFVGLPSALNLPQANPGQVAEYAPVPPTSHALNPQTGNFAAVGLGSGSTLTAPGAPPAGTIPAGTGPTFKVGGQSVSTTASQFRCVLINGVAHQTEDPLSPPCVASFVGNNGGATARGVTADSISVVYYMGCDTGQNTYTPTSQGSESMHCGEHDDADTPASSTDFLYTRAIKRYAAYFNSRYETYGRHVHIEIVYGSPGSGGACNGACRRQDEADAVSEYHPFSFVEGGQNDSMDYFTDAVAQNGILDFGSDTPNLNSFYEGYPGLVWSYIPTIEQSAAQMSSFLCQQMVGKTASFSGAAGQINKVRKFGVVYFNDGLEPSYTEIKDQVDKDLAACGVSKPPEYEFDDSGSAQGDPSSLPEKSTELSEFEQAGVTTILWFGPPDGTWGTAASAIDYHPEWVAYGDGAMEDFVTGRYVDQSVWSHAMVVSNVTLVNSVGSQPCALALESVDPSYPASDVIWNCGFYNDMRQLFTGIQVAGPDLTVASLDQGFHAIPADPSTSPEVPACFYGASDYTCVKDAVAMYWDPNGVIRGWSGNGCYKDTRGGLRYLTNQWPTDQPTQERRPSDPCNGYTSNSSLNPYAMT